MSTTLIFDLDSTLYPHSNGYEKAVRANIYRFMHEKLGVEADRCESLWKELYVKAGQSLRGLRTGGFKFDKDEYWDFIRQGTEDYIKPDPDLHRLLLSLPQPKWVLTNAQEKHAHLALKVLGIEDCFKGVYGSDFMDDCCKPAKEAFVKVIEAIGCAPESAIFFDDALVNVKAAKELGMRSVLVVAEERVDELKAREDIHQYCDAVIGPVPTEANLKEALPELFATAP